MYTRAVEDIVEVPVKFTLKAGKVNKPFAFTLICKRKEQDDITAAFKEVEFNFKNFLESTEVITDWVGQKLVLDQAGNPAEFCPEALSFMLNTPGVAQAVYVAYSKECAAKEKN